MKTFNETQKAFRIWLLAVVSLVWLSFIVFTVWSANQQLIKHIPVGDEPMPDWALILFLILFNLVFAFFVMMVVKMRLEVEINHTGIRYSYPPFMGQRKIEWSQVAYCWVRKYRPINEYGGWGYRSMLYNKAYNVWGKWGIQIIKKDGRKILLGTMKKDEAALVLSNLGFNKAFEKK